MGSEGQRGDGEEIETVILSTFCLFFSCYPLGRSRLCALRDILDVHDNNGQAISI